MSNSGKFYFKFSAHLSCSDRLSSVVCRPSVRPSFPSFFCKLSPFSSTGPISTKLGTKHPCVKRVLGFTNKDHSFLKNEIMVFCF